MLLGAHMSIAGGVDTAIDRGASIGCTAIQIFTKNNNQWHAAKLKPEEIKTFLEKKEAQKIKCVFAHDSYLINLGSPKPDLHEKSVHAFKDEIDRAEQLQLYALVFHPGAHTGDGEAPCIQRIGATLKKILKEKPNGKTKILIENTAGQGSNVGYSFEQIAQILEAAGDDPRLGVCFDTQHAFAAGYDLRTQEGYEKVMKDFEKNIGTKRIQAFHLNDSKKDLGDQVDRHEHIGKGLIGLEAFRCLMNDKRFATIPKVLETPKGDDMKEDVENLALLRSLLHAKK